MVKYSFIVPVYNTEKYLRRCIDSLIGQTYKDFEIIIINDGSTDDSKKLINKYMKKHKNISLVDQENQGLSVARNEGVKKATGKYLIFIDSDDYVEKKLLENIEKEIDGVEVLRYQIVTEEENGAEKKEYHEDFFDTTTGFKAFEKISLYHFVEPAWCYVFEKDYYLKNDFKFKKGIYHEDFGLIPYVIYKARKVKSIDYIGYHYITRQGSIMNNSDYQKTVKKAYDMLNGYKVLKLFSKNINKENNYDDYYLSYISNCVVVKARELKKKERKTYLDELKKLKVYNGVLVNTTIRKLKKKLMKFSLNLYLKVIK